MKVLQLTALDGSKWNIPATVIADSFKAHYGPDEEPDDGDLIEWAGNDMNWTDVKDHAVQVKGADALDMQDSWCEGDFEIIDQPIRAVLADTVKYLGIGAVENYECRRCGKHYQTDQEPPKCDRGPCPMERAPMVVKLLDGSEDDAFLAMPVPLDADELAALKLRLSAARAQGVAIEPSLVLGHVALLPEQADGAALALKATKAMSKADMLALYYGMREDAATILAGVEPGDHGDAIIAAFGERVIRAAIHKAAGL